jgi:glyoxylase-like metal-dependent hydrolase (beta-lactamase superfamily II)
MIHIKTFTFNPFAENTYLLYADNKDCIIIDAGCSNKSEEQELFDFIAKNNLNPILLLNTHCHIDHILGTYAVLNKFNIPFFAHHLEKTVFESAERVAQLYHIIYLKSKEPDEWIDEHKVIELEREKLQLIHCPGHSPGSLVIHSPKYKFIIAGDVLFRESIGRTDLPFSNHIDLITSIKNKLYILPNETMVYSGHGETTEIGHEKQHNFFIRA